MISRPPRRSKFANFWTLKFLALNIRGHGENTPYSSSEPNESDIVNRQSGGEKLKYVLKFYIGGTSQRRNDTSKTAKIKKNFCSSRHLGDTLQKCYHHFLFLLFMTCHYAINSCDKLCFCIYHSNNGTSDRLMGTVGAFLCNFSFIFLIFGNFMLWCGGPRSHPVAKLNN